MTGVTMLEDALLLNAGHCPVDRPVRALPPKRTHLDLFSGIGGFALAAKWAGFETVGFCEIDPACRRVLEKHWPGIPKHEDVKVLNGSDYRGVDLLTGGFPCQPFSQSNTRTRRGMDDPRFLWPDMLRVIAAARPRVVLAENSTDIDKFALDTVLDDLGAQGYEAWPVEVPAAAVGANHLRYRTWILANARGFDARQWRQEPAQGPQAPDSSWWDAYRGVHRVDDGLRKRLDGRKRMLGNAIVPMVAYQMLRALVRPNV